MLVVAGARERRGARAGANMNLGSGLNVHHRILLMMKSVSCAASMFALLVDAINIQSGMKFDGVDQSFQRALKSKQPFWCWFLAFCHRAPF
jgi:hypothetical protein